MAMTTEELVDRLRFDDASEAVEELTAIIETMRFSAPESMILHVERAAETLNEIAVALCVIIPPEVE